MDCRALFINLLASLNLLEVTQLVIGIDWKLDGSSPFLGMKRVHDAVGSTRV